MKKVFCREFSIFCLLLFTTISGYCQTTDTLKLPFAIADEKRLPEEDLKNKKEGLYVTGIPDFSLDPVNGFGYGGEGSLFFNGKRTDPFFAYTAYRAEIDLTLFNTTRNQREATVTLDVPYLFNTKWRLRAEAGYEKNPNLLYFGSSEATLEPLSYYPGQDSSLPMITNARYRNYSRSLSGTDEHYDNYIKEEYILNVSGERSYLDGKLRLLAGFEGALVNISTFDGNSRLRNDYQSGMALGIGKSFVVIEQVGVIYDTRDLETDPSQGIFSEITNELSLKSLGSAFDFNKTFIHFNYYHNLVKTKVKKWVMAARIAGGYTAGNAPFFEYQDQWSSEGSIEGLGGSNTLRGYKQSRFLARTMTFSNVELRYRFAQTKLLKQHLAFVLVPSFDIGAVSDQLKDILNAKNYRYSEGIGLRIIWNVNTVLRFDYAVSKEDNQFFFNLSHTF